MTKTQTEWTVDEVAARFAEAAEIAHKLPRVRPGGYFNPWMTLAMQVPERYPDPERLYRPMPPSPQAVERMLETMRWVQWLEVEQRHLVWMRSNRYRWERSVGGLPARQERHSGGTTLPSIWSLCT